MELQFHPGPAAVPNVWPGACLWMWADFIAKNVEYVVRFIFHIQAPQTRISLCRFIHLI